MPGNPEIANGESCRRYPQLIRRSDQPQCYVLETLVYLELRVIVRQGQEVVIEIEDETSSRSSAIGYKMQGLGETANRHSLGDYEISLGKLQIIKPDKPNIETVSYKFFRKREEHPKIAARVWRSEVKHLRDAQNSPHLTPQMVCQ